MFERILVVCLGNICRSPVAEALLKQRLPNKQISSAGLHAMVGHKADNTSAELALADTLDLSAHAPRQLSRELLQQADLVLVMTDQQRRVIAEKHPDATGKVMLFGQWLQDSLTGKQGIDIPDPYGRSPEAFEHVHKLLVKAADAWHTRLS